MLGRWPRWCELLVSVWLVGTAVLEWGQQSLGAAFVLVGALSIMTLSAAAAAHPQRKLHLAILVPAFLLYLLAYASVGIERNSALGQQTMTACLLLVIFCVLPTNSLKPPAEWGEFYDRKARGVRSGL